MLNDLFEMCDIDGDGRLSREEFNLFQQVTSDEDVDDEAWEIVTGKNNIGYKEFFKLVMKAQV